MAAGLFESTSLRLNPANLYEVQDVGTGATLARLVEVARVRSPRGHWITPDRVRTPRLTFAVTAPDGTALMYYDRAEHQTLNPIAPQTAFVGTDGRVLARLECDSHSTFHGGGRVLGTTDQGWFLAPGARLHDPEARPLGDLVFEQPPNMDRPILPDGRDARTLRWMTMDGVQLAERRNGDLHIDGRVTGAWRAIIIGSYLAMAFEFHLPINEGEATETVPNVYPGYTDVHTDYNEFQRDFMIQYRRPMRTRAAPVVFRAGVQRDQLEHLFKLFWPVGVALVIVLALFRWVI
ncbi:hypothetical protein E1200_16485 [Actinomadura sp. GC306]|uniref:hypothetical protein n=1 Tax=Actinomadura sp. GC306 TaxID=2530367 RepID=UPI00104EFB28|nr:hypothetical protein [Actinomadura sp. GC306]TDC66573.1 hypothetical protein E1200_16485 [Actinomadura sp. GC306]